MRAVRAWERLHKGRETEYTWKQGATASVSAVSATSECTDEAEARPYTVSPGSKERLDRKGASV